MIMEESSAPVSEKTEPNAELGRLDGFLTFSIRYLSPLLARYLGFYKRVCAVFSYSSLFSIYTKEIDNSM